MGNCRRIFFSHPLVPIVCSAAPELAGNQSQSLLHTNKHGIVASPRAGTQQSNTQFSQVIAGRRPGRSISRTPSCLCSPVPSSAQAPGATRPGQAMLEETMKNEPIQDNTQPKRSSLMTEFFVQGRIFSRSEGGRNKLHSARPYFWALARGKKGRLNQNLFRYSQDRCHGTGEERDNSMLLESFVVRTIGLQS